jgi:hypothetical protein
MMDLVPGLGIILAGCLAGYLAGACGAGGGIILVPVLIKYFESSGVTSLIGTHLAIGSSALVVGVTSVVAAWPYARERQTVNNAAIIMILAGVVLAVAGSMVAAGWQGRTLCRLFGVAVGLVALILILGIRRSKSGEENTINRSGLLTAGGATGLVVSWTGIGGDVFSMPYLYGNLRFSLRRAQGTALLASGVVAIAAAAAYGGVGWGNEFLPQGTIGFVEWKPAIPAMIGQTVGISLARRFSPQGLSATWRKIYAVALLVLATKMFFLS